MNARVRNRSVNVGDRFGLLVVVEAIDSKNSRCACDCGGGSVARNGNLLSGNTGSCGCRCRRVTHGQSRHGARAPEYIAWQNMQRRVRSDKNYAGRVSICDRWSKFENFFADMGPRPSPLHSVERTQNSGNYEPGNCVWATKTEQQNNRRVCRYVEVDGVRLTVTQWSRRSGISVGGIAKRLRTGWDPKLAVTLPPGVSP